MITPPATPTTINSGDIDGVLLVAAQALEKRTLDQKKEIQALRAETADLRGRLAALERRVKFIQHGPPLARRPSFITVHREGSCYRPSSPFTLFHQNANLASLLVRVEANMVHGSLTNLSSVESPTAECRGDWLTKIGRFAEARQEFERAASLTQNGRERKLLLDRAAACSIEQSHPRLNRHGNYSVFKRRGRHATTNVYAARYLYLKTLLSSASWIVSITSCMSISRCRHKRNEAFATA